MQQTQIVHKAANFVQKFKTKKIRYC